MMRNMSNTLSETVAAACLVLLASFIEVMKYRAANLVTVVGDFERGNSYDEYPILIMRARTNPLLFGYTSKPKDDKLSCLVMPAAALLLFCFQLFEAVIANRINFYRYRMYLE